jgi:hypothetical protein
MPTDRRPAPTSGRGGGITCRWPSSPWAGSALACVRVPASASSSRIPLAASARLPAAASPFACSLSEAEGQRALTGCGHPATEGDGQAQVFVRGLPPDQRRILLASVHGSRPPSIASPFACSLSEAEGQPALTEFRHPAPAGDGQAHVFFVIWRDLGGEDGRPARRQPPRSMYPCGGRNSTDAG